MKYDELVNYYLTESISPKIAAMRAETEKSWDNKLLLAQKLKNSGLKCVPFPTNGTPVSDGIYFKGGELLIINDADRDIVLIDLGNIKLPFYKSTGEGGKTEVPAGKWYPYFGNAKGWGWFNKTTQRQIRNYYGSEKLKVVSQQLDSILGDNDCGFAKGSFGSNNAEEIWKVLNQDLNPASSNKDTLALYANIANVLPKVGGLYVLTITGQAGSMDLRIPTEINSPVIKRIVGEEAKYFSNPQYTFFKVPKFYNVTWGIKPNPDATNKTYYNDQELVEPMSLVRGAVISIGNKRVGKITIDV
jgi:hypothetical protein